MGGAAAAAAGATVAVLTVVHGPFGVDPFVAVGAFAALVIGAVIVIRRCSRL